MGALLNTSQVTYAEQLARHTGLDVDATMAWLLCEEPASRSPALQGYNWLNLLDQAAWEAHGRSSYSGAEVIGFSPAGFARFANLDAAAGEAAFWITQFSNYVGIRASADHSALAQVDAIAASPWDAGHYDHGVAIRAALARVQGQGGIRRKLRRRWVIAWTGAGGREHHKRVHAPFIYGARHGAIKTASRRSGKPIQIHPR